MTEHIYISIDLKSFYASVECIERGLDPLNTNLVVADTSRTEKTICLAVSPSLKAYGISGRARLFEVIQKVQEENCKRLMQLQNMQPLPLAHKTAAAQEVSKSSAFTGSSYYADELKERPWLALDYIAAPPRMALYIKYSTRIYDIYLRYVAPEDIHVYSIDEVFMDITTYLAAYKLTPYEFTKRILKDVLDTTGITAAAGIGTNLYLCKVAMDIVAKHIPPDSDGVRIASLNEMSYRRLLWDHTPITDFWRVGRGYAKKLHQCGLYTMGDIARCSLGKSNEYYNEELLYKLFGINAELLIDHAWGYEPCTIADVKAYRPEYNSIGTGQVLCDPYTNESARLVVKEMTDLLALDLVEKKLVTSQLVLTISYDIENLTRPEIRSQYKGEITTDPYGRRKPKHAHGTTNLPKPTSSARLLIKAMVQLYDQITNPLLLVRKIHISANKVRNETHIKSKPVFEQLNLFTDYDKKEKEAKAEKEALEKERRMQEAIISIKKKYGKNAVLKGMNLQEGATTQKRNNQIGGHNA